MGVVLHLLGTRLFDGDTGVPYLGALLPIVFVVALRVEHQFRAAVAGFGAGLTTGAIAAALGAPDLLAAAVGIGVGAVALALAGTSR